MLIKAIDNFIFLLCQEQNSQLLKSYPGSMYRWECGHNIDREYFLFISVDWEALVEIGEERKLLVPLLSQHQTEAMKEDIKIYSYSSHYQPRKFLLLKEI